MNDLLNHLLSVSLDCGPEGIRKPGTGEVNVFNLDSGNGCVELRAASPVSFVTLVWSHATPSDSLTLGDAWERTYGGMEWLPLDGTRLNPWYVLTTSGGTTQGFGMCVQPNAIGAWKVAADRVTLILDVRNGGENADLTGRTVRLCEFVSGVYTGMSPYRAGQNLCRAMAPHPLLPDRPLYGGNNWYYAYGKSSREQILSDTKLQAELSEGLENRPFMVIDDGWSVLHTSGPWDSNERFGDMAALAREIKAMDVRPGIWIRFLNTQDPMPGIPRIHGKILDPSDPRTLTYVQGLVRKLTGWGYELIKYDYTGVDIFDGGLDHMDVFPAKSGWHFADRTRTTAEIIKDLYRTVYEASEGRAVLLGCNTINHLAVGMVHAARTGDDTSGADFSYTLRNGYNALGFKLMQNRTFFAADADCVGFLPNAIPWEQNLEWATLLAKSGSPLFISCAYGTLSGEQRAVMKELYVLASKQTEDPEPADWFETRRPVQYKE
ncbi:MAG: hypothetical protein IKS35_02190 [Clostridia bacterium]|nr:hypothetical protein [Clostridia bacterium]